ncbi:MAG: hypothetical protein ABS36_14010 [Acidobacteria bacterium SCN 69-37]|nr:MAG: hypothetical protein ABS36_14010 [Acidobacteria bacterium SCN 69-37]
MATCPECDAELEIDEDDLEEMEVGDPWDCEACGSRLRVAVLDPLEFDSDEDEDDEDSDDEGDDDADDDEDPDEDEDEGDGEWDE